MKNTSNKSAVLFAFYDLAVNPNSFDIAKFLVLAELYRVEKKYVEIHLVITPDKNGWARSDDLHSSDQQEWRLRNILLPAMSLVPSIQGSTVFSSREEAAESEHFYGEEVFPENYNVSDPIPMFEWADIAVAADRGIPSLSASPQARQYAKKWIEERAGKRKVVSLTLREMHLQPHRNNNHEAWIEFARKINNQKYYPVLIRDTHYALDLPDSRLDGLNLFSEAAFNLELRMGFYEECYLNLFVNNGPAELALLNTKVACLFFMKIISHSGGISQEVPDYAIPFRGEHPVVGPHQHTVWDGDTLDVLDSEFEAMVKVLDNNQTKIGAYRSQGVLGSNISIGRELLYLLLRGGKENQADYVIKLLLASGEISETEAKVYKGKARLEADRVSEAIFYLRQALEDDDSIVECHEVIAMAFVRSGEMDLAIKSMRRAVELSSDPLENNIKLAMTLNAVGETDEAEILMRGYLDNGVSSSSILLTLSETLRQKGDLKGAIELQLQTEE